MVPGHLLDLHVKKVLRIVFDFAWLIFFAFAGIPLVLCGLIVTQGWSENFGNRKMNFKSSCGEGLRIILHDKKV